MFFYDTEEDDRREEKNEEAEKTRRLVSISLTETKTSKQHRRAKNDVEVESQSVNG